MELIKSPAAERNKDPILAVLRDWLPERGTVLEIAGGTGQHAVHFAANLPTLQWQPTDPDESARRSIEAWREHARLPNLLPPLPLDVCQPNWPLAEAAAIVCINMIHISPWASTLALFSGAATLLTAGAPLVLYGPYRREAVPTAPSNEAFDQDLRRRNPAWGLRQLEAVDELAGREGFERVALVEMPANNLTLVYRKRAAG